MSLVKLNNIIKSGIKALKNPLIKNMIIVGAITLLVKVLAFYKETIVAGTFGLSELLDTYLIAVLVPSFIQSIFINSLKNIFIPNYIADLKNGGRKSSFQSVIFIIVLGITLFSVLITFLLTDVFLDLVYPGHTDQFYQLVKDQLAYVLPCLFFWGISSFLHGLLEIEDRFLIANISGVLPIITMILFLVFLKDHLGYLVLAKGTLVGTVISFLFILFFSIKHKDLELSKPKVNDNVKLMIKQLPPKISSSFLTALNNYVDQFFAAQLVTGSIAALSYGVRIPSFGVAIVIMALGNVLLPHFSRLVNDDIKSAYQQLFKILKIVIFIGIIVVIIAVFMSDWVIELLFERDEFTHQDTLKVSKIQQILLIHTPFYLCTLIMVKFLTSINKNNFMAWISLANLTINIILNMILIKYFDVYGLALSTSLVLMLSSSFYFLYTYRQYKKIRK